jgi:hypothetical protein
MRKIYARDHWLLTVGLAIATCAAASPAYAQSDEACIEASEKALTLRNAGRLLDSRKELARCAASICPDVVKTTCRQRLGEVNQALPAILFDIKDAAGRDLANVRLTVDGAPYAEKLAGGTLVLDPGDHEFKFEVAGQGPVVKHFVLHETEKNRRESIVIGGAAVPVPPATPATTTTAPTVDLGTSLSPAADTGTSVGSSQKAIGLVVGGAGLAGVVLGSVFGAIASSKWHSSQTECPMAGCADHAQAVTDHDAATSAATVATVGVVVGGAALATGIVLFFTAPHRTESAPSPVGVRVLPSLGPGKGGILLEGVF